jgi:CRP/FNR family cyclic AMP-dependent transcriptional regulator
MDASRSKSLSLPEIVFADVAMTTLPAAERAAILSAGKMRTVRSGEVLYRRGDAPDGMYIVVDGIIRIATMSRTGEEFILDLCGRGMWIGELGVLEGQDRTHDAVAETRSTVLFLSSAEVERLLATWSAFSRAMLRLEARRFRRAVEWAGRNAVGSLDSLLAARLVLFVRRDPLFAMSPAFDFKITQTTLARWIGTTRQRMNQVLQEWEAEGLVRTRRGSLQILKFGELERKLAAL